MEVTDYSLPAGIYSDDTESYKPDGEVRNVAKLLKYSSRHLYQSESIKKKLKSLTIGAKLVRGLLNSGQEPALLTILSYLSWFDLALILSLLPLVWQERHLAFLAITQSSRILTVNSRLGKRAGTNLPFFKKVNIFERS